MMQQADSLQIGITEHGQVRLLITMADGTDVGMDFDPDDADEIAEELKAAAQAGRKA